jgi:hypothetical protein
MRLLTLNCMCRLAAVPPFLSKLDLYHHGARWIGSRRADCPDPRRSHSVRKGNALGAPASSSVPTDNHRKSTFAQALQTHFPRFQRCNQDDLGNRRMVEQLTRQNLRKGNSVCIDRTNFDAEFVVHPRVIKSTDCFGSCLGKGRTGSGSPMNSLARPSGSLSSTHLTTCVRSCLHI